MTCSAKLRKWRFLVVPMGESNLFLRSASGTAEPRGAHFPPFHRATNRRIRRWSRCPASRLSAVPLSLGAASQTTGR